MQAGGHVVRRQGNAGTQGRHYQRARAPTGGPYDQSRDEPRGSDDSYVVAAGWAAHSPRRIARAAHQCAASGRPPATRATRNENSRRQVAANLRCVADQLWPGGLAGGQGGTHGLFAGGAGCGVSLPWTPSYVSRHYWQLLTTTPRRCSAHDPNGGALAASVTSGRRWQQLTGPAV